MFRACIFDLDGTLLDTLADIAASVNTALEEAGHPTHEVAAFRYFVGDGVEACMRRVLPEDRLDDRAHMLALVSRMRDIYVARAEQATQPYPGIEHMLQKLAQWNLPMAVLSNKPHPMLLDAVGRFFTSVPFVSTLGVSKEVPPKPELVGAQKLLDLLQVDPAEICYVGDTNTDMETAKGAGFYAVGVSWGFRPVEELEASGAQTVVTHPDQILDLIAQRNGLTI